MLRPQILTILWTCTLSCLTSTFSECAADADEVAASSRKETKPEQKPLPAAERRRSFELEQQQRLSVVEPDFAKVYFLKQGEVLRHVSEPLDRALRQRWYDAVFGPKQPDEIREIVSLYLQWKDGKAQWNGATVGADNGGMPLPSILSSLNAVSLQDIEGDEELLEKRVTGDWVFDPQASAEDIVAAMQMAVEKEWKIPVTLQFREVERDVCVVKGNWRFEPISEEFDEVQIYGHYLNKASGSGGGTGNFDRFLRAVGSWIKLPIINEVADPPRTVSWRYHKPSPFTQQQYDDAHDPGAVTANLTIQTRLEYRKESRKVRILFIEKRAEED